MGRLQPLIDLDVTPANPGAETNSPVADGKVADPGNPAQIDQYCWAAPAGRRAPASGFAGRR